jgi:hypothetical protein
MSRLPPGPWVAFVEIQSCRVENADFLDSSYKIPGRGPPVALSDLEIEASR